ncbi:Cytochrome B5-like protein [Capsicum annuum]|nr:Cytochrome B5-like protein [Capsicum annuum]
MDVTLATILLGVLLAVLIVIPRLRSKSGELLADPAQMSYLYIVSESGSSLSWGEGDVTVVSEPSPVQFELQLSLGLGMGVKSPILVIGLGMDWSFTYQPEKVASKPQNKVFDVTSYVEEHPGGDAILDHAGDDSTEGFYGFPQSGIRVRERLSPFSFSWSSSLFERCELIPAFAIPAHLVPQNRLPQHATRVFEMIDDFCIGNLEKSGPESGLGVEIGLGVDLRSRVMSGSKARASMEGGEGLSPGSSWGWESGSDQESYQG